MPVFRIFGIVAVVLSLLFVSACATVDRVPPDERARQKQAQKEEEAAERERRRTRAEERRTQQSPRDQRQASSVQTPFRDPTEVAGPGGASKEFELPYTRQELKQSAPLVIDDPNATPYEDPGTSPIKGNVAVSESGDMVKLPDGTFIIGMTDEDPFDFQNAGRQRVTISGFYMDRFEVTNAEYRRFLSSMDASARRAYLPDSSAWANAATRTNWSTYFYGSSYDTFPVVTVTWSQAKAYCEAEGKRLPTEAEWEYAARAGRVGGVYPWAGFSATDARGRHLANYNPGRRGQAADGYAFTAPVGTYPPSRWGLHDMAGNVAEWVHDDYRPTYFELAELDPVRSYEGETRKVVRGGAWDSSDFRIGVGFRDVQERTEPSPRIGFRCAADISAVEGTRRSLR